MAGIFNVDINRDGAYNPNGNWYSAGSLGPQLFPRQMFYDYGKMAILAYITEAEYDLIIANFADYVSTEQFVGFSAQNNITLFPTVPSSDSVTASEPPPPIPGTIEALEASLAELQEQTDNITAVNQTIKHYPRVQVNFIGPKLRSPYTFTFTQEPFVNNAPIYFIDRTPGAPVHKLVYITTEAQTFLKTTDLYGQNLATINYFGPYGIPIYWGGEGDGAPGDAAGSDAGGSFGGGDGACGPGGFGDAACSPGSSFGGFGEAGGYDGGTRIVVPPNFGNSGVYGGSLSSQGLMVNMQLNTKDFVYTTTNGYRTVKPYHEGYFKTYYRDPRGDIFGANTQMPALTGAMPSTYTDLPGNAVYLVDLQLYRLSGSNQWDQFYFINTFNQIVGWVTQCNNYLQALKTAENTDLAYYGAENFKELTTQGFDNYQVGTALVTGLRNIGIVAAAITVKNNNGQSYFGTANCIAEILIDNGLGYINNLSVNLYGAGVNFDDIGNSLYTDFIEAQLRQITSPSDLNTIQQVLESNIPNFANPLDYTRIDRASGLPNDSLFDDFQKLGEDFVNRAPNIVIANGIELANLIDKIQSNVATGVESLSGTTSLLNQSTINSLRSFLPTVAGNEPITMLDVIGMASGYQNDLMTAVNEGVSQLFATSYGPQIRDVFTEISRLSARVPLTTAERNQTVDVWDRQLENKKNEYYTLINTIMADNTGNIPAIRNQINSNWDAFTSNLYYESKNYNKANIQAGNFGDNQTVFSFVQSIPGYAADQANIATDYMLYGLTQDNIGGETARTVLDQGKNDNFLQQAGVTITGIL